MGVNKGWLITGIVAVVMMIGLVLLISDTAAKFGVDSLTGKTTFRIGWWMDGWLGKLTTGRYRVIDWDRKIEIVLNQFELDSLLNEVRVFEDKAFKFPGREPITVKKIVVAVVGKDAFLTSPGVTSKKPDLSERSTQYDGSYSPIRTFWLYVPEDDDTLVFSILLDYEVIKEDGWSESDLSAYVLSYVYSFTDYVTNSQNQKLVGQQRWESIFTKVKTLYYEGARVPLIIKFKQ